MGNISTSQAIDSLLELSKSIALLLDVLPGLDSSSSVSEIGECLGIHRRAAWQLQRIATTKSPIRDTANVPSEHSVNNLLSKAGSLGAPIERVNDVRSAYRAYQRVVSRFADDNDTFSLIVNSAEATDEITERYRRDNYRTLSKIIGMKSKCRLAVFALAPSPNAEGRQDGLRIDCHHDVWQLRKGSKWLLTQIHPKSAESEFKVETEFSPLDPDGLARTGLPIIRELSSSAFQNVSVHSVEYGKQFSCSWEDLGRPGGQTCTMGVFRPAFMPYSTDIEPRELTSTVDVRIPAEHLVIDVLLHKELPRSTDPTAAIFPDHQATGLGLWSRVEEPLPLPSDVTLIGSADKAELEQVTDYSRILSHCFDRVGWRSYEFDVYRYHLTYPIMPSTAAITWKMVRTAQINKTTVSELQ